MGLLESLLVLLVLVVSIVYLLFLYVFSYWKNQGVPYEEPVLPYGNSKDLVYNKVHFAELTQRLYTKFKTESPFYGIYLLIRPIAIITDLDLIKNILIKDFNYFADKGIYTNSRDDPLSAHLFSLDGPEWKFMRTKLSPTFTSGKMKFMFPTILKVGNELENSLSKTVEDNPIVEMKEILARFTTDVIGSCAFGIDCNSLTNPNAEFRCKGREIFLKQRHGRIVRSFQQSFPKAAKFLRMKNVSDDISKFFLGVVAETVKYREENNIHRNDFMDMLLELKNSGNDGNELSLGQIAAQAFVFFIAGFETSSTTMSYCLYELAQNQDIQDKLRSEINAVLKKHNGILTYEGMLEMTYLDQVISESLRKYPPVPLLFRKSLKNYSIPGTKLFIERNTSILIPNYAIQNDPELYPKPEIFDPERFSPEQCKNRHPCAFLPFGDGPRNCIGLRFGKMQARVGLVTLLKNFKYSVCPTTPIPMKFYNKGFLLTSESGIDLKVEKI